MLTMGYRGPVMMPAKFVDNPLDSVPNQTIRVWDYEVADAIHALSAQPWSQLNSSQRREVVRCILTCRQDEQSKRQLDALGLNIPGFNNYEILVSGLE